MTRSEYAIWVIRKTRPRARFVACSHSEGFIDEQAGLDEGFSYISLYDEKIDSNVIRTRTGLIVIDNSYLPSFAYNLALCSVYVNSTTQPEAHRTVLLKNNFKKFFAEQLLFKHNNSFSRAIFLETLLYEERSMRPVFTAAREIPALGETARLLSQIMSSLVVNHELGHIYLNKAGSQWASLYGDHLLIVSQIIQFATESYGDAFATELKCDLIALNSALHLHQQHKGMLFCLRAVAFGFGAFAVMTSLTKSAEHTAGLQKGFTESIDLKSIKKSHIEFNYDIIPFTDMIERARLVIRVCEDIATLNKYNLYGSNGEFSLQQDFFEELLEITAQVMETDDLAAREMSLLVAQAFDQHPDGINYLYLRSKVYTSERDLED